VQESPKTKVIYTSNMGLSVFQVYSPLKKEGGHFYEERKLEMQVGPHDIRGISGRDFATFALNDSKYIKGEDSVLVFDVYSKNEQDVTVSIVENYGENQKVYSVSKKLVGGDMWQKICVRLDELKCNRSRTIDSWEDCEVLALHADEDILVNNVLLT